MRTAVYTGSFDPITLGHRNVIRRASRLVDRLVVGIGHNAEKSTLFSPEERLNLIRACITDLDNVVVEIFEGLAVDFVRQQNAVAMIRGVRPLTDIAGEFTMSIANRQLDDSIETVFLMSDPRYAHVSSTLIKQIAPLADNDQMGRFIPEEIIQPVKEKLCPRDK